MQKARIKGQMEKLDWTLDWTGLDSGLEWTGLVFLEGIFFLRVGGLYYFF